MMPNLSLLIRVYLLSETRTPDLEAWHLFDTILFAVHRTSRAKVVFDKRSFDDPLVLFPLMSIVWLFV